MGACTSVLDGEGLVGDFFEVTESARGHSGGKFEACRSGFDLVCDVPGLTLLGLAGVFERAG